ncbi:hypothetical protein SAMN05428969_1433 [Devosia sp. YR412]|uniref:hypothetical protein n=1 Tax=Devosia sp. YR412 TaxID=1881030 RepID=UPI0008B40216|nr:hypothetical protein [Devosia sp. YR412]SEP98978.1 hypothetical protein SAMN05428969_1433 [Devosia sp. YR412]
MISAVMAEQPIAASSLIELRSRPIPGGERSILPDSAPPAPATPKNSEDAQFGGSEQRTPAQPEPPVKQSSSSFAAAVLSGALSPAPQTMSQLFRRIGISPIPEESQARLKDLTV